MDEVIAQYDGFFETLERIFNGESLSREDALKSLQTATKSIKTLLGGKYQSSKVNLSECLSIIEQSEKQIFDKKEKAINGLFDQHQILAPTLLSAAETPIKELFLFIVERIEPPGRKKEWELKWQRVQSSSASLKSWLMNKTETKLPTIGTAITKKVPIPKSMAMERVLVEVDMTVELIQKIKDRQWPSEFFCKSLRNRSKKRIYFDVYANYVRNQLKANKIESFDSDWQTIFTCLGTHDHLRKSNLRPSALAEQSPTVENLKDLSIETSFSVWHQLKEIYFFIKFSRI